MGFIDGTIPYPTTTDSSLAAPSSSTPILTPIQWTQQDQTIMSMLISSLTEDVLPLIVGTTTSREVWNVLEQALVSPSNTRILNLHFRLQNLFQNEKSISQYLHEAKTLSNELATAGRPLPLADLNIYVFKGLRSDFKNLVTTLSARSEPVSFSELHALLLSHEFIHGDPLSHVHVTNTPPEVNPSANLTYHTEQYNSCSSNHPQRSRGRAHNSSSFTRHPCSKCQICRSTSRSAAYCHQRYAAPNYNAPPTSSYHTVNIAYYPSLPTPTNPHILPHSSTPSVASHHWYPDPVRLTM